MLDENNIDKSIYNQFMEALKKSNSGYTKMYFDFKNLESDSTKLSNKILKSDVNVFKRIKRIITRILKKKYRMFLFEKEFSQLELNLNNKQNYNYESVTSNYFSNKRIAIYTVIFGKYDEIAEPLFIPDNCDYFIITDNEISENSKWKKIDVSKFHNTLSKLNNIEKNRFFKMNPHLIFEDYEYSIYIDGNVQPVADLTEYVYKIGKSGIGIHIHCERNCVYAEGRMIVLSNKDTLENIIKHLKYVAETNMPKNYGLFECNVIVREHHNDICKKIMEDWWNEFLEYSNRDQISFMHALYINNINIEDVGIIGRSIYENPSFRINIHK